MAARLTAYLVAFIVSATFIAGLIVGAQRDDDGPVDLIVVNGSVYTAQGEPTRAEAVAVQGNKILMVGSNRDVQRLRRPQTIVVDAKGGTVLPGFNDTSVDLMESSLMLSQINLVDADTMVAVESAVKAWVTTNPDREWVLGSGWTREAFGDRLPTRHQLDALVADRPAFLLADDGQSAWVNSAALHRANITRRTPNPENGTIGREHRSSEPSGILTGDAIELVTRVVPVPTDGERRLALRAAIEQAHRRGVTSVQDIGASVADLELYDALRRAQKLDLRVYAAVAGDLAMTDADLDAIDALRQKYADDPVFKTGAVALVANDDGDEDLRRVVTELDERGWQVIIQAISDGAVRIARDAVDYASRRRLPTEPARRHRVERVQDGVDEPAIQFATVDKTALAQVIDAHTRDAAWASFDEHRKGTLERDMLADLVILTNDIFAAPADRIGDTDVAVTIFDGRVVFSRSVAETNE
jgi:predicted amidohydrolase YtcJ